MEPIDKLIFEADIIASIPRGARISTSQEFINIELMYFGQSLCRAFNRESREKAVTRVCNSIELLIAISDLYLESKYLTNDKSDYFLVEKEKRINVIKKIHSTLIGTCNGINSLCDTYQLDSNVLATLKPLLVNINNQISCISKFLVDIGQYQEQPTTLYINIM